MAISSVTSPSIPTTQLSKKPADADNRTELQQPAEDTQATEASALHSFTNGMLGLDDPTIEKPVEAENKSYTSGKFMAALGTIGTIISVLV